MPVNNLNVIEYKSLSDITAERLRQSIIIGQLGSGAYVTETEVAQTMGVSRVVVREAMLMLMRQGLLVKERNRFTKVVDFMKKDVEDIFDLRIAIEQAAARRCLGDSELVKELASRANDIKTMLAKKNCDKAQLMYLDMDFHVSLIKFSDNARFMNVWEEISGPLFILLYRYMNLEVKLHYSHSEIINAIQSGNEAQVDQEIKQHIEDTKQAMIELLPF